MLQGEAEVGWLPGTIELRPLDVLGEMRSGEDRTGPNLLVVGGSSEEVDSIRSEEGVVGPTAM